MKTMISAATCVTVISNALLSRRAAIQNEMAVGIALFYHLKNAKDVLATVYSKSGYDCKDSSGKDYKTVARRMAAAKLLFKTIGAEQVGTWIGDLTERKMIAAVSEGLNLLELNSIDDVMAYCGRPREKTSGKEHIPLGYLVLDTENIHMKVPKDVEPKELFELSAKILELAHERERELILGNVPQHFEGVVAQA